MKEILSIIAILSVTLELHAQTKSPKEDFDLQEKFIGQINHCVDSDDYWQLEKLCDEKADSLSDALLTWSRGVVALRFLQFEEAKKQMGKYVHDKEIRKGMDDSWLNLATKDLITSLDQLQQYDEAAKVADEALRNFADDSRSAKFKGALSYYQMASNINHAFSELPKMTMSHDGNDISIPFRIETFGEEDTNIMMKTDGTLQGKPFSMMFDTGAGINSITKELADKLNLKTINANAIIGGAGDFETSFAMADSMQIGNMKLRNVKFVLLETDSTIVSYSGHVVIGFPIMELMEQFTMDFDNGIITSAANHTDYSDRNILFVPWKKTTRVRIHHNGKPFDMTLDTGNGGNIHLDHKFYEANQEEVDWCPVDNTVMMGIGGEYAVCTAFMRDLRFELNDKQYCFPQVEIYKDKNTAGLSNSNMGLHFISSFKRVTLSLKDAHIEFEEPKDDSQVQNIQTPDTTDVSKLFAFYSNRPDSQNKYEAYKWIVQHVRSCKTGLWSDECKALSNIALMYDRRGNQTEALNYIDQAISVADTHLKEKSSDAMFLAAITRINKFQLANGMVDRSILRKDLERTLQLLDKFAKRVTTDPGQFSDKVESLDGIKEVVKESMEKLKADTK